ncbi:phage tail protein [Bradyrhizobium sp. 613_E4_N2_2]|uniref:phage tail protein n=1 Tax=Bradyrhizobium sp. 613_E4_N2_2 TaxID=3240371 RepID=UPI003F886B5F
MPGLRETLTGLIDLAQDAFLGNDSGNAPVLLMLGTFKFSLNTAVFQEMQRRSSYAWGDVERFGKLPALQYMGPDDDAITLPGVVFPDWKGGSRQVDDLRKLAEAGVPYQLIDAFGGVLGDWVILGIEETQSIHSPDGSFRRQEFSVRLRRYA